MYRALGACWRLERIARKASPAKLLAQRPLVSHQATFGYWSRHDIAKTSAAEARPAAQRRAAPKAAEARWFRLWALPHQSHTAGDIEQDVIDKGVAGDLHVELSQCAGIGVGLIWIGNPPAPQHVVQHDHATPPDEPQRAFEIVVVAGLVSIDEREVKAIDGAFMFERPDSIQLAILPRLDDDLASWRPPFSAPGDYAEQARRNPCSDAPLVSGWSRLALGP
jgi:hypothetical protein